MTTNQINQLHLNIDLNEILQEVSLNDHAVTAAHKTRYSRKSTVVGCQNCWTHCHRRCLEQARGNASELETNGLQLKKANVLDSCSLDLSRRTANRDTSLIRIERNFPYGPRVFCRLHCE